MKDKYIIVPLLITLLILYAGVVYFGSIPRDKHPKIPQLNSTYVYDRYLSPYAKRGFHLLAAQFREWHPHSGLEFEWRIYLYHPNGTLAYITIGSYGVSKREYPTFLDYSPIAMPIEALREFSPASSNRGYVDKIYFLNNTNYRIMKDEYHGISRCRNITSFLLGKEFKLVKGLRSGSETALLNVSPVGGVFVLTGSYSYNPLCRETWLVVQPYNKTHDRVGVIYADVDVWGFSPRQDLQVFNGSRYSWLVKKHSNKLGWGDVEGLLMNATGIYLNPHARLIFERSYKRGGLPGISSVIILNNGTVKTWGMWIERGRARNAS